jgi:hypothetical protein
MLVRLATCTNSESIISSFRTYTTLRKLSESSSSKTDIRARRRRQNINQNSPFSIDVIILFEGSKSRQTTKKNLRVDSIMVLIGMRQKNNTMSDHSNQPILKTTLKSKIPCNLIKKENHKNFEFIWR